MVSLKYFRTHDLVRYNVDYNLQIPSRSVIQEVKYGIAERAAYYKCTHAFFLNVIVARSHYYLAC